MAAYENLCMNCMADRRGEELCPECGSPVGESQPPHGLAYRTMLGGRYLVGKVHKENGEGLQYIGYDTVAQTPVKIQEFFPQNLCRRGQQQELVINPGCEVKFKENFRLFVDYSNTVSSLRDIPSMEKVYEVFEENQTAYSIAEWNEQITLRYFVERSGGTLHWNDARQLFVPVMSALSELHAYGVGHYGLSPDSIAILKDGTMRLIHFAISPVRQMRTSLQPELISGCAALEQYVMNAPLTEATDVYGLAASLFFALTGDLPQDAIHRQKDGKLLIATAILRQIPPHVVTALANALQVPPERRLPTIAQLQEQLAPTPAVTSTISIEDTKMLKKIPMPYSDSSEEPLEPEADPQKKSLIWLWVTLACLGIAGVVALLLWLFLPSAQPEVSLPATSSQISSVVSWSMLEEPAIANHNTIREESELLDSDVETVDAPNLLGKSYTRIAARDDQDYDVMLGEKVFDEAVPEGDIVSQTPEPGEKMIKNGTVVVKVSQGSAMRILPDVQGLSLAAACEKITSEGFTVVKQDVHHQTVPAEQVIGYQSREAGDTLRYGTQVTVLLSRGPQE